jgi:hypothetical protein
MVAAPGAADGLQGTVADSTNSEGIILHWATSGQSSPLDRMNVTRCELERENDPQIRQIGQIFREEMILLF